MATLASSIRPLTTLAEFQQCVEIQGDVWGYDDNDIVPRRMFLLARKIGGQVLGAFVADGDGEKGGEEKMAGFAMALPAYRDGQVYLHSHMLAVLAEYRDAGLGRRLKLAQRDDAIARGIERMEWTYDPLQIKNSYLNIAKLGAISRRYEADFYGPSSSPLQGGLPTDRLYAEWWLRSPRVEAALRGERASALNAEEVVERILVPQAIAEWKAASDQRARALEVQMANRIAFEGAFRRGLAAVGYERDSEGNGAFLLGRAEEVAHGVLS
jgi:predicted GNAT superfamily acetyltransferase